ncbi:MAG: hypothetical protein EP329_25010 [Deltaproteobacteria bacterium]|nr:MAG: hypothetical protein EP329_25010 [Deltaproteobacteria bacterium]
MAQRIIGLDVGTWSVKAVVLESSLRRSTLVDYREHHIPSDANGGVLEGEVEASIAATLRGLDRDAITAALPGTNVLMRELELPFADDKRIQSVLGFQLESVLPRPLDEVVYDYQLLRETEDGATLLCAAVDRVKLDPWLTTLQAAGADPRVVTTTGLATANLLSHLAVDTGGRSIAFVDLGHRTTTVTIARDGRVDAVRTISRGGHQLTQALARGLDLDYAEAEQLKHEGVRFDGYLPPGVDEAAHAQRAKLVARALEPLLREVRTTIHAHAERLGHPVVAAVAYGGTSLLPGVLDLMQRVLDMPVSPPAKTGPMWEGREIPAGLLSSGVAASALALRSVADAARHQVNFRQGEHAYESDFTAIRGKLVGVGIFVMVLIVLFFARKYLEMKRLEGQQAQLSAELDTFTEQVFGETFSGGEDPFQKFSMAQAAVMNPPETVGQSLYPAMTAFKIFYDATAVLANFNEEAAPVDAVAPTEGPTEGEDAAKDKKAEKKQVELTGFSSDVKSLTQDFQTATMSGYGYDVPTIEGFRKLLAEHRCFKKVEQVGDTKPVRYGERQGWKEFSFKIEIKCDKPEGDAESDVATEGAGAAADGGND